jgi:hypothetical protein
MMPSPIGRLALVACVLLPQVAESQLARVTHPYPLQASHNWQFRQRYPAADRLFNAFDYGHAILSETLFRHGGTSEAWQLDSVVYRRLVHQILNSPPRLALEESPIMPSVVRLVPEVKAMFEWAHVLHRQVYDVWADERIAAADKDAAVAAVLRWYRSRPELVFSDVPKSMALMQEQPFSLAFRKSHPRFNGLLWSYHWMQMALYEPLVTGTTLAERQAGVAAAVARFREMLVDPPRTMPYLMPMTPVIAPTFTARYPEIAAIFDNLHSLHDVVSDILANPAVPRSQRRALILRYAAAYRDDTTEAMPRAAWITMSQVMGIENQGGPSLRPFAAAVVPTVSYGFVMRHDRQTGLMLGADGKPMPAGAHTGHEGHVMPAPTKPPAPHQHEPPRPAIPDTTARRPPSNLPGRA